MIPPVWTPPQLKALLVEDHPVAQRVHQAFLQKMGCLVDVAENGRKALALSTQPYDIILLDINLPDLSGLEICRTLRKHELTAHTPIIALTAYGEIEEECLSAGIDIVISKPVIFEKLQTFMKRIIEHKKVAT